MLTFVVDCGFYAVLGILVVVEAWLTAVFCSMGDREKRWSHEEAT